MLPCQREHFRLQNLHFHFSKGSPSRVFRDLKVTNHNSIVYNLPSYAILCLELSLDINYLEEIAGGPQLNVATLPNAGKIVLLKVRVTTISVYNMQCRPCCMQRWCTILTCSWVDAPISPQEAYKPGVIVYLLNNRYQACWFIDC